MRLNAHEPRSAAESDICLAILPSFAVPLVQYRIVGGTLDWSIFSGSTAKDVIEQYGHLIWLPTWQPPLC